MFISTRITEIVKFDTFLIVMIVNKEFIYFSEILYSDSEYNMIALLNFVIQ